MSEDFDNLHSANDPKVLLYALTELLIDNGIIDRVEFSKVIVKWQKTLGIETDVKPLEFLASQQIKNVSPVIGSEISARKRTVLVVDDVPHIRKMIKSALHMNGYFVIAEAGEGKKAIDLFTEFQPGYVLMDIEMKGMNGLDALRQIRSFDQEVPIIIITGNPKKDYLIEAMNCSSTDFIVKPVDVNRLIQVMKKFQT